MNHLELFEAGMEAFNEGDAEAFVDFCDPDRPRGGDVDASAPIAWLVDFRDELVWRGRVFMRHEEALEEAGLAVGSVRPTR